MCVCVGGGGYRDVENAADVAMNLSRRLGHLSTSSLLRSSFERGHGGMGMPCSATNICTAQHRVLAAAH
jgi:hypothetical protein